MRIPGLRILSEIAAIAKRLILWVWGLALWILSLVAAVMAIRLLIAKPQRARSSGPEATAIVKLPPEDTALSGPLVSNPV